MKTEIDKKVSEEKELFKAMPKALFAMVGVALEASEIDSCKSNHREAKDEIRRRLRMRRINHELLESEATDEGVETIDELKSMFVMSGTGKILGDGLEQSGEGG